MAVISKTRSTNELVGKIEDESLFEILEPICVSRANVRLDVWVDDDIGHYFFSDGRIVHGESNRFAGRYAVYDLIHFRSGIFKLKRDVNPPAITTDIRWEDFFDRFQRSAGDVFRELAAKAGAPLAADLLSSRGVVIARYCQDISLQRVLGPLNITDANALSKLIAEAKKTPEGEFLKPREGYILYFRLLQGLRCNAKIVFNDLERTAAIKEWVHRSLEFKVNAAFANSLKESDKLQPAKPQKKRILLIDDDDNIRKLVRFALKNLDVDFMEASDGQEGYRTALKEVPDLIILDLSMPNMNGFEACQKLKEHEKTGHIPIIVLSGESTDMNKEIVTGALKANAFLGKPFDRKQLVMTVMGLQQFEVKQGTGE
ncbi:MAG: response regulator [Bdellovibrionota bacterium]